MRKLVKLLSLLFLALLLFASCVGEKPCLLIGVSQCSDDDWRTQLNNEILREALFYPGVKIVIRAANDDNNRQINDIREMVDMGVDLLIVSPNVVDDVSPAIEQVYAKGIPVVLVDRRTRSDHCTAYVGANNYDIGRRAGQYIASRLQGHGTVLELTGLSASTPAIERHRGLADALAETPDIHIAATVDAEWEERKAEAKFDSLLDCHRHISLVFAHNDRMAAGAYRAALHRGREKEMLFVGVDALPGEGRGVDMVSEGKLDATFVYPTGGDKVLQVAMDILQGKPYEHENTLSTALVNKANARIMMMQNEHIGTLDSKIETLDRRLDAYLMRYSMQRALLLTCAVILVLTLALLFFVVRAFWTKKRMNAELSLQKRQLEQQRDQLIELSRKLEDATQAKLAFFTRISHDLRTPLSLIADPIEQLSHTMPPDKDYRFLLDMARRNVVVLTRLVGQLLDFRKYEEGKLKLDLSLFDLKEKVEEWAGAFRCVAYSQHIRYRVDTSGVPSGCMMAADAGKLERIFYNLLSNAFKFTPADGSVTVTLSLAGEDPASGNGQACLEVADTGTGLSPEQAAHVFEDFYQADNHREGSGIGLALVKAFTEMHGGRVTLQSEEGRGSVFRVSVPLRQDGGQSLPGLSDTGDSVQAPTSLPLAGGQAMNSGEEDWKTILVIDDNTDIRAYLAQILGREYRVIEADNGMTGLDMAAKYVPDAIVCDVMMPVMDGMECCRRLKSGLQTSHIPVIMLTAYAMEENRLQGYECGADSYMAKPFSTRVLLARLRNLAENRKRLQHFLACHPDGEQKDGARLGPVDRTFLDRLWRQIEDNLSDPAFSVEEMGAKMGLGRVQLYRKTKALTGHSPNELLRDMRLRRASGLLATTDKTVAEVAYMVGFTSPSYFAKCYKECFGENPTDFVRRKSL